MKKFCATQPATIMRIGLIQLLIIATCITLTAAGKSDDQILDRTISLSVSNVPFEYALGEISNRAKIKFVYSPDHFRQEIPVNLQIENRTLRAVLDELCTPRHIHFSVYEVENTITLKKVKTTDVRIDASSPNTHMAATRVLTGTITDSATGNTMAGVNILIKGTTNGTNSDANGKYAIEVDTGDKIICSFIGYATRELTVGTETSLDIQLSEEVGKLNEVVINAGYYSTTKTTQTGNISKITAKEIEKQPVSNPIATLQGVIPGLQVTQQTGVPGSNYQIRIRGQNSIANGNEPLILIDGVPYLNSTMSMPETSQGILLNGTSPLNSLNPADIESIEVLKDADATAIYGSRGANGVILISTKKGQSGKTKLNVNVYQGVGSVTARMNLLNSSQYLQMRREALTNDGLWPLPSSLHQYVPDVFVWDTTRNTDWQKELIGGKASTTDAQFTLSGGDRNINFSWNAGYHRDGTVFPGGSSDTRLYNNLTLGTHSSNEKFNATFSTKFVVNSSALLKQDLTLTALTLAPVAPPLFNDQGNLNWGDNAWNQNVPNPIAYTRMGYQAATKNLLLNATTSYQLLPQLEAKLNGGYSYVTMDAIATTPKSALPPEVAAFEQNQSTFSNSAFNNWNIEPQLHWKSKLANGTLDMLLGATLLNQVQEGLSQYAFGFADESLMKNLGAATSTLPATNYYGQYRYESVFFRLNYLLSDKYIINATGRRDGSSRFGPGKQYANFGALGAAWIFSRENILAESSFLSLGKLRASMGVTGNDQIGDYQYLDTYTPSGIYGGQAALAPARLANSDFAWETNKKLEAALDLGFFTNKLLLSVAAYRNRSSNQLIGMTLPPSTGFASVQSNMPAVIQNSGLEIELSSTNIETEQFTWTTAFNFSAPNNKLLEFPNLDASPAYASRFVIGEPLSILKRYQYTQLNPATGLYQFKDTNGDGTLNTLDRQRVVFVGQKFFGGLQSSIHWKQFQFDFLFQYVKQERLNYLLAFAAAPGNASNQPDWVVNRWTSQQPNASTQKYTFISDGNATYSQYRASDKAVSDASFIRLKNVYMAYTLPTTWTQKANIQQMRLFMQAQNLFTWTKFLGLDPETGSNALPPLRIVSAGINFSL